LDTPSYTLETFGEDAERF